MIASRLATSVVLLAGISAALCVAQTPVPDAPVLQAPAQPSPDAPVVEMKHKRQREERGALPARSGITPFSSLAIGIKAGLAGPGLELATPVASRMNLRVGGSLFSFNPDMQYDGITITGDIQLRSITEAFDIFPFGNTFRISPGITFYNGNHINAAATVPGGQTFTLDGTDYISSPSDPIHGTFDLSFGNQLAPSLTIGVGNMIPRHGGHWSAPFEIGAEYLGRKPQIALNLAGSACQGGTAPIFCQSIATDPNTQANVVAEQAQLNSDIPSQLRFFPIISLGVSYSFRVSRDH